MAKYSTGSSNSNTDVNDDTVCELCGSEGTLSKTSISGTTVIACKTCKKNHGGEHKSKNNKKSNKKSTDNKKSWQKYATTRNPDNDWVEKTRPSYGNADTPYLINNYSKILEKSIYENNVSKEELSKKINVSLDIIESILNSNAIKNNVTKKQIVKIEDELNITLQDE